jgi:predicted AAA+ superfamily ATPase
MLLMFTRLATAPNRSFFLLGPRSTGKTTWLRELFPNAHWYNLLLAEEFVRLSRAPQLLRKEVELLPKDSWVIIDEVQRIPELLNEVHDLLSRKQCRFVLSGSSARKLRRNGTNLLAGRALTREFYPLVKEELGERFSLDHALKFGMLPDVWNEPEHAVGILTAYADTYLREEVLQEGLVKNLGSFSRFLEVAGLMNGQIINVSSIASDAQVARQTVQGYFDILKDTLIATEIPAFRPRLKVRETAHPKLYFFDCGLVRALTSRLRDSLTPSDKGFLLETLLLNEIRAYLALRDCGGDVSYWRSGDREVDFIISRNEKRISIEVKASERWRPEYSKPSHELLQAGIVHSAFGVYAGERAFLDDGLKVFPYAEFVARLYKDEIWGF